MLGVPPSFTPSLVIVGGQGQNHVAQKFVQRGLQGGAEVSGVVPGEGHQQAVSQELRRDRVVPTEVHLSLHTSLVGAPPTPVERVQPSP